MQTVQPIYEILEQVNALATPVQRKNKLKEHINNKVLREVLKCAFDPNVKFLVSEDIKYKPTDALPELTYGRLYSEMRRMYVFTTEGLNMTQQKRDKLWADLLESVDPKDAEILVACTKKTLPYENISAKNVKTAFPDLF